MLNFRTPANNELTCVLISNMQESDVVPRFPDPVAQIYSGFIILPENTTLDTEDPCPAAKGRVKVRALNGFLFKKGGKFVYPRAGHPIEWWQGVTAYGYIAALTGDYRYFVWAGEWDEDYDGKHMEVVILGNLKGITKEKNIHWRNGQENILWLDTELGYSYALLESADEYDRGSWATVTASWTNLPDPAHPSDPIFVRVNRHSSKPAWWDDRGKEAWEVLRGNRPPARLTGLYQRRPEPLPALGLPRTPSPPIVVDSSSSDEEEPEITCLGHKATSMMTQKGRTMTEPSGGRRVGVKAGAKRADTQESRVADQVGVVSSDDSPPPSMANRKAATKKGLGEHASKGRTTPKTRIVDTSRAHLKRRVVSNSSASRRRQKQKTEEAIYVGSSDEDDRVNSSPPPAPSSPTARENEGGPSSVCREKKAGTLNGAQKEAVTESKGKIGVSTEYDEGKPLEGHDHGVPQPQCPTAMGPQEEEATSVE